MEQVTSFDKKHKNSEAFLSKTGVPYEVFLELVNLLMERFSRLKIANTFELMKEDVYLVLNKIRTDDSWRVLQVEYNERYNSLSQR